MKVLFLCETVTMSHVVRPLQLAKSLEGCDVVIASTAIPEIVKSEFPNYQYEHLRGGVRADDFQRSIYLGKAIYDEEVLENYIIEDCRLINKHKPDIVVSDFRLSTPISCKLNNVPLISLGNIVWSPYALQNMLAPDTPIVNILGVKLTSLIMKYMHPLILSKILKPMNNVRKSYKLPLLNNIFEMYVNGDIVCYLDPEGVIDNKALPDNHSFIGPVLYSTKTKDPYWKNMYNEHDASVLVALGSSGDVSNLNAIIEGLEGLPVKIAVATSGRSDFKINSTNVFTTDYLDLDELLQHTQVLIGNGGSSSNYHALSYGVPVIGVPYNLDQYLSTEGLAKSGAGIALRSGNLSPEKIRKSVIEILNNPSYKSQAVKFSDKLSHYKAGESFKMIVSDLLEAKIPA